MIWKVVARADNPDQQTLSTLEELTGLGRGEVLLALRRNGLTAGDGLTEERARSLSASLSGFGLQCTVIPSPAPGSDVEEDAALFRVVLTGYKPGNRARLRECLERLSGLPPEQVVLWLGRIPFVLKDGIDHETARRIRKALSEAGGMVELKPSARSGEARQAGPGKPAPQGVQPPPVQDQKPAAAARPRAIPEQIAAEKEPPTLPEPPVLEGAHVDGACPPRLRFFSPGRAAAEPPVIPGKDDLARVPPAFGTLPQAVSQPKPPGPSMPLAIFMYAPSRRALSDAAGVLRERLDFRDSEIPTAGSPPVWIATVGSADKAAEITSLLEDAGATVIVRRDSAPFSLPQPKGRGAFLSWLHPL